MKKYILTMACLVVFASSCQKNGMSDQDQSRSQEQYRREEYRKDDDRNRRPPPPPGQPGCCENERTIEQKSQVANPEVKVEKKAQ